MLTMEKAQKILQIAYDSCLSLNDIFIKEGKEFSYYNDGLGDVITIIPVIKQSKWTAFMDKYLKNQLDLDPSKYMFYGFLEVFSLLHEIGHSLQNDKSKYNKEYVNYKEKVYSSYEEAYTIYRNLSLEKDADKFASNFMKDHKYEIWSIMNDITFAEAIEEYNFWNE